MKIWQRSVYLISAIILFCIALMAININHTITDYHQTFIPLYNDKGELRISIRMYYRDDVPYYLVVNPEDFTTEASPVKKFKLHRIENNISTHVTMQQL